MKKFRLHKKVFLPFLAALLIPLATMSLPKKADAAFGAVCCACLAQVTPTSIITSAVQRVFTTSFLETRITAELTAQRVFLSSVLFEDHILPAMMLMADQLSATAVYQTQIIGSFFDAKHQLETQRTLEKIRARAHKDYHPSTGMCEIGTNTKSLVASERKSELVAHVLSQQFQDRMLGNSYTAASGGQPIDTRTRLKQYREKFCDPMDNGGSLFFLCEHDQDDNLGNSTLRDPALRGIGASDTERMNKDVDYHRTVEYPWTLDVDFANTDLTNHEEEIIALGNNIYGHDVFERVNPSALRPKVVVDPVTGATTVEPFTTGAEALMDARSMLAKLSVAKNSYNSITSMKASGTAGSRDFMEAVLSELGVTNAASTTGNIDDMRRLLGFSSASGEEIGPSYYAQMEVLTRKIYQNPDFYTNLYDKPANVERKRVAMQAIGLMQKFDLFKSYLRQEANMSILLEIAVMDLQDRLEEQIENQPEEDANPGS